MCACVVAGVQAGKLVEAHGSFASASCIQCNTKHNAVEVKVQATNPSSTLNGNCMLMQAAIFNGKTPRCRHKHCYVSSTYPV